MVSDVEVIYKLVRESIWWHDVWYSIWDAPGTNEKESAALFTQFVNLGEITEISHNETNIVVQAIEATQHHLITQIFTENSIKNETIKLMLDVDMVGFAKNYEIVKWNSENILKEYEPAAYSRKDLLNSLLTFLNKLSERKRIFYNEYFYNTYEVIAHENIIKSIDDTKFELQIRGSY